MRFSLLLFILGQVLTIASWLNHRFKQYISKAVTRILIKTADGKRARLFTFDKGRISTRAGDTDDFDVALVWQDAATGYRVMTSRRKDASFHAASEGKLKVLGMSVYAQWFEDAMKRVL